MNVQELKISEITLSGTNPRKRFNEDSLRELSESIKKNGLIQPVTVRPLPAADKRKRIKYELVSGERRLKAHKISDLKTIPSIVREMSDEEAFDVQVVENLQREDIHPLEEADGFVAMMDSGRFDVKEIAERVGKSESYVLKRLRISEMIGELKTAFYQEKFGITHALEMCRLTEADQYKVYDSFYQNEDPWNGYPKVSTLIGWIDQQILHKLEKAPFDPKAKDLVPDVGSCMECPKRSGANPTLFGDVEDEDMCFDSVCFEGKANAAFRLNLEQALNDSEILILRGYGEPSDEVIQVVEESGKKVLKEYDDFYTRHEEKKGRMKGFFISGRDKGEYVWVELNRVTKKIAEELGPEAERQRIIDREARAVELDREKVQKAAIEFMNNTVEPVDNLLNTGQLLCYATAALYHAGFDTRLEQRILTDAIKKLDIGKKKEDIGWGEKDRIITRYLLKYGDGWTLEILRSHFQYRFTSSSELDPDYSGKPYAFKAFASALYPDKVNQFEQEQAEKAAKRKKRVEKRLAKLEEKEVA